MVLSVGHKVPGFALPDPEKKTRTLEEFTQNGTVIIAFYPFAFSGVCDKEMCTFRDSFSTLSASGAQVVGISVDSVFTQRVFAQTYNIPFPLLSDFNKKAVRLYGVLQNPWVGFGYKGVAKRSVFVVDKKGILRYKWITDSPGNEPPYDEVMKAVQKIPG